MSVDTKGFIAADKKDIWEVSSVIEKYLKDTDRWLKVRWDLLPSLSSRGFRVIFMDGDDQRILYVFFGCDCDYKDVYDGQKITMLFGDWGNSREIIKEILERCRHIGDIYFNPSDCDDSNWKKL